MDGVCVGGSIIYGACSGLQFDVGQAKDELRVYINHDVVTHCSILFAIFGLQFDTVVLYWWASANCYNFVGKY